MQASRPSLGIRSHRTSCLHGYWPKDLQEYVGKNMNPPKLRQSINFGGLNVDRTGNGWSDRNSGQAQMVVVGLPTLNPNALYHRHCRDDAVVNVGVLIGNRQVVHHKWAAQNTSRAGRMYSC